MHKLAIVAALALLSAGVFFGASQYNLSTEAAAADLAFEQWLGTQNKAYNTPAEKNFRKSVFAANKQKVEQSNQVNSYTLALNMFADLTEEEFVSKYTGLRHQANLVRSEVYLPEEVTQTNIDWRTKNIVNKVKDQGQCGSCWAFSATSTVESTHAQKYSQQLFDLSEQQLVDCAGTTGNQGCNGGWMDYAFKYLIQVGGQMKTSDYPYTARDGKCKFDASKVAAKISGFQDVPANNCKQLIAANQKNPVSVAIAANAIMMYSKGVFDSPNCGTGLNHGVTLDGFGTDAGKDFYLVRNSWGGSWGEQGYIRMSRSVQPSSGICGICMAASYPIAA